MINTLTPSPVATGSTGDPADISPVQRTERLRRRVNRLEKMGMFDLTGALRVWRVGSMLELQQAYHLVHDTYVQQGYILPQPSHMRLRTYEAVAQSATFVAKSEGQTVGVIGLVFDSPDMGLPSDDVFADEINALRKQGRKVAEVTNLAVAGDYRATRAFLELCRAIWAYAAEHQVDDLFISISAGHALFFETVLGFDAWGDKRTYDQSTDDQVEGKRLDMHHFAQHLQLVDQVSVTSVSLHDWFITNNPYRVSPVGIDHLAQRQFLDPGQLFGLFVKDSDFLIQCTPEERAILRHRWGAATFDKVYQAALALQRQPMSIAA